MARSARLTQALRDVAAEQLVQHGRLRKAGGVVAAVAIENRRHHEVRRARRVLHAAAGHGHRLPLSHHGGARCEHRGQRRQRCWGPLAVCDDEEVLRARLVRALGLQHGWRAGSRVLVVRAEMGVSDCVISDVFLQWADMSHKGCTCGTAPYNAPCS